MICLRRLKMFITAEVRDDVRRNGSVQGNGSWRRLHVVSVPRPITLDRRDTGAALITHAERRRRHTGLLIRVSAAVAERRMFISGGPRPGARDRVYDAQWQMDAAGLRAHSRRSAVSSRSCLRSSARPLDRVARVL